MHTNQNANLPYPERDTVGDAPLVVEPITEFAERVWWGSHASDFYLRYTPAFFAAEALATANAWRSVRRLEPSPIGSRFD